ncbi:MAG TPA: hypothetical protein VGC70_17365 [Burkholderiales bacterium]
MDKTSKSLSRTHSTAHTTQDNATQAWSMTLLVAAVVMVIVFTALWVEQLISTSTTLRSHYAPAAAELNRLASTFMDTTRGSNCA